MDFLLICPPVSNFGQAAPALSVLTAFLRSKGWKASQWDLGIEAFHHFYGDETLRRCRDVIVARDAEEELQSLAHRVVADIARAKETLRRPGVGADTNTMRWALHTIRDASVLLTAASGGGWELQDSKFDVPGALRSFEDLEQACADPERNPFLAFFEEHAATRLLRDRPRAVGISVTYFSQLIPAITLAALVRRHLPGTPVILGGAYLTATGNELGRIPTRTLLADAVVLHDGEVALDAWLGHVLSDAPAPSHPNLWVRDEDRYRRTSFGPSPQVDLDTLPIPMWIADGLDLDRYLVPQYPIALPLSRGCYWGRCVFCNISSQTSSSYRRRSVDRAIADIKAAMAETGSRWFDFPVDSFRPKHLRELALAILEEGLDIEWGAEVLLDRGFKDDLLADLARSGCRCLRFGMESACPDTLRSMNKPARPDTARKILGSCRAHGIRTAVMFIVGFPSETQGQLQDTYDFVVDNRDRIDFLTFHSYSLVLGSPMAEDPGKFGLYLKPGRAVFSPNLPFVNTNPGGMQEEHVADLVEPMRESLREHFPDLGELWTVGIGGWMTFANCCEAPRTTANA